MAPQALLGVSVFFSLLAWGSVAVTYVWPALRGAPLAVAMRPLLALHAFRFIGLAFLVYLGYRFWIYWKHRAERVVPRVQVGELERRVDAGEDLRIFDVRSHGYYDAGSLRIRGSMRFEPNNFEQAVKALPKDKLIFLYCT